MRFRSGDWGSAVPFSFGWWSVVSDAFKTPDGLWLPRGCLIRFREWYGMQQGRPNVGLKLHAEMVGEGLAEREAKDSRKPDYGVLDPSAFKQDGGPSIAERIANGSSGIYFIPADNARKGRPMVVCFSTCRDSIRTIPVHAEKAAAALERRGPLPRAALYSQKSNNNAPFQVNFLNWGRPIFSGNRGRKGGSFDAISRAVVCASRGWRLNDELEQRVLERTSQLMLASEALREAQTELAHVNRVTTMGQLAASIAHELNQPLAASVTNACAGLRWLGLQPPNLEEVREALAAIVTDSNRASHVINRMRALIKKAPPRKDGLQINEVILEVTALTRGELVKSGVSLQTQLAQGLPLIQGDRVQLQQVLLNLIMNAVEAMGSVNHGSRELLIGTGANESGGVRISVQDSGPGLNSQVFDRLFDPFYTTKADGMGMGLSICRSIIEAHDGRIWASAMPGPGSTFNVSLPGAVDKHCGILSRPTTAVGLTRSCR